MFDLNEKKKITVYHKKTGIKYNLWPVKDKETVILSDTDGMTLGSRQEINYDTAYRLFTDNENVREFVVDNFLFSLYINHKDKKIVSSSFTFYVNPEKEMTREDIKIGMQLQQSIFDGDYDDELFLFKREMSL
jgi:hypothetical protein